MALPGVGVGVTLGVGVGVTLGVGVGEPQTQSVSSGHDPLTHLPPPGPPGQFKEGMQ